MIKTSFYKCVFGDNIAMPNQVKWLAPFSNKNYGQWVGYCEGDKSHKPHFIVFRHASTKIVLDRKTDPFRKTTGDSLRTRVFPRMKKIRCPIGKVYMILNKRGGYKQPFPHIDIYRCQGSLKGTGHRPHLARVAHGLLDTKQKMRVLIVTFEKIQELSSSSS